MSYMRLMHICGGQPTNLLLPKVHGLEILSCHDGPVNRVFHHRKMPTCVRTRGNHPNETHSRNEPSPTSLFLPMIGMKHSDLHTLSLQPFPNPLATVPRSVLVLRHLGHKKSLDHANACTRLMYS